jgi:hypothetical protein
MQQPGRQLESTVAGILTALGYVLRPEEILASKRVDLIAQQFSFGKLRTHAVECKDYAQRLDRDAVVSIVASYADVLSRSDLDQLLIVTRNGLSPAAATYVSTHPKCAHQTLAELERSLIDFTPYLNYLVSEFDHSPEARYYVSPLIKHDVNLTDSFGKWLQGADDQPIALVGSYGMGKTTFARFIAAELARTALRDSTARIPILISLGQIASEQNLEGLFGRQFTANYSVRNYSWSSFERLNRLGKFVVLLDGFDEMKHTLSWNEFRYNFQQLVRLVVPGSRVMTLGRTTAFITERERIHILHGRYERNGRSFPIENWPDFREEEMQPFNQQQISVFLQNYFRDAPVEQRAIHRADEIIRDMTSRRMRDLAQRPVQLQMLAQVLPGYRGDVSRITTAILYDQFIDLVIERELKLKPARQRFGAAQRRDFAREVAWWLWSAGSGSTLTADAIPEAIILRFAEVGDDTEAVRRDLTAGCFLDRKFGGSLYFPHRSFQEFLVAEKLYEFMRQGDVAPLHFSSVITVDVGEFLTSIIDARVAMKWVASIGKARGTIKKTLLSALTRNDDFFRLFENASETGGQAGAAMTDVLRGNPWYGLLRLLVARMANRSSKYNQALVDYYIGSIGKFSSFLPALHNAFCAIVAAAGHEKGRDEEVARVVREIRAKLDSIIEVAKSSSPYTVELNSEGEPDLEDEGEALRARLEIGRSGRAGKRKRRALALTTTQRVTQDARFESFVSDTQFGRGVVEMRPLLAKMIGMLTQHAMISEWSERPEEVIATLGLPERVVLSEHSHVTAAPSQEQSGLQPKKARPVTRDPSRR